MTALRALTVLSMAAFVVAITLPPIFMTPPHIVSGVTGFQRGAWLQPNFVRVAPGVAFGLL